MQINKKLNESKENNKPEIKMRNALSTISKGGAMILFGGFIAQGLGFLYQSIVAKYFGPADLGILALSLLWLTIALRLATGGFGSALKKFLPIHIIKKDNKNFNDTIFTIFFLSLSISIPFSVCLYLLSDFIAINVFDILRLSPLIKIVSFIVPIQCLLVLLQHFLLSLKDFKKKILISDIGFPFFRLIILVFVIFISGSIYSLTYGNLIAVLLIFIIALIIIEIKISKKFDMKNTKFLKTNIYPKNILNYSLPLLFSGAVVIVFGKADTFILGLYTSETSVGIYNYILTISLLLTIFLISINQIFFPVISHLYAKKNLKSLSKVFEIVLRWDFLLTLPFFIFLTVFSKQILEIFFPAYASGWKALVILSFGMMFRSGFGPVGHTLETFGKTKFIFLLNTSLLLLNIALNLVLIPKYGIEGAAFSTAFVFSLNNIFEMWKVKKLITFKIKTYLYIKYCISAFFTIIIFFSISYIIEFSWFLIIIMSIIYLAIFFVFLVIFKSFINEDIFLFEVFDIIIQKITYKKISIKKYIKKIIK